MDIEKRSIDIAHEFSLQCKWGKERLYRLNRQREPYIHSVRCRQLAYKIGKLVDTTVREVLEETLQKSQMDQGR